LEIDHGHQRVDERDLERGAIRLLDPEAILTGAKDDIRHHPDRATVLVDDGETDQISRPVLTVAELATLGDSDLQASNLLGCLAVIDPLESQLESSVDATNRPHHVRAALEEDGRAGLDAHDVFFVDIDPQKAVQAMGTTETPDDEPLGFSRGTRRQR